MAMHVHHEDGTLIVSMPMTEFLDALVGARAAGVAEGAKRQVTLMQANGVATNIKKVRATTRRKKSIPRPAMRQKRKAKGKKRDWSAIVAKRLATQKLRREQRAEAAAQQAQAQTSAAI